MIPDKAKEIIFKEQTDYIPSYKFDEYDIEYNPIKYEECDREDPYIVKPDIGFTERVEVPTNGVVKNNVIVTDDCDFKFTKDDIPEDGTEFHIKKENLSGPYVKYKAYTQKQQDIEEYKKENIKRYKNAVRELDRKEKVKDCIEFWDKYDIPIDYDLAINIRKSGLTRGSSGTGRAKDTVNHLRVLESFENGRLKRDKYDLLCNNESDNIDSIKDKNYKTSKGEKYPKKITCKKCKKMMERWS